MRGAICVVLAVLIQGCDAESYRVRGPDGSRDWWSIECSTSPGQCAHEAGERCPHGYETSGEAHSGTLLVKCKGGQAD